MNVETYKNSALVIFFKGHPLNEWSWEIYNKEGTRIDFGSSRNLLVASEEGARKFSYFIHQTTDDPTTYSYGPKDC